MADEASPLLGFRRSSGADGDREFPPDPHKQFCKLIGVHPSDLPRTKALAPGNGVTLYERAVAKRRTQTRTYALTAALSNTLLLGQVLLSATLTALGASESSHVLITVFGVLNTVIAGLVAYLKSRGQPMRARMFRDDLERVVEEIENSETMWLGITRRAHGYDQIDIDDEVSVRSEVARLTRLYDNAVKSNAQNNPDLYMGTGFLDAVTGLHSHLGAGPPLPAAAAPAPPAVPSADPAPAPATPPPGPAPVAATEAQGASSAVVGPNTTAGGGDSTGNGKAAPTPDTGVGGAPATVAPGKDKSKADADAEPAAKK